MSNYGTGTSHTIKYTSKCCWCFMPHHNNTYNKRQCRQCNADKSNDDGHVQLHWKWSYQRPFLLHNFIKFLICIVQIFSWSLSLSCSFGLCHLIRIHVDKTVAANFLSFLNTLFIGHNHHYHSIAVALGLGSRIEINSYKKVALI